MSTRDEDIKLLRRLVDYGNAFDHGNAFDGGEAEEAWIEGWLAAFTHMLTDLEAFKFYDLTDKQRAWARGISEKVFDEPEYANLFSSGKLAIGRPVPTPAVLQNLPKKPPKRRTEDE